MIGLYECNKTVELGTSNLQVTSLSVTNFKSSRELKVSCKDLVLKLNRQSKDYCARWLCAWPVKYWSFWTYIRVA